MKTFSPAFISFPFLQLNPISENRSLTTQNSTIQIKQILQKSNPFPILRTFSRLITLNETQPTIEIHNPAKPMNPADQKQGKKKKKKKRFT